MRIDRIDRAIVDELSRDGRLSNVALAEKVHLTPGPCLRRVQRLEAEGIIRGYRAEIDPGALDRGFVVMVDLDLAVYDRATVANFEETAAGYPEVIELHRLFGTPDYFLRIAVADLPAYEQFLMEKIQTIPGISKVHSRFAMKVVKS